MARVKKRQIFTSDTTDVRRHTVQCSAVQCSVLYWIVTVQRFILAFIIYANMSLSSRTSGWGLMISEGGRCTDQPSRERPRNGVHSLLMTPRVRWIPVCGARDCCSNCKSCFTKLPTLTFWKDRKTFWKDRWTIRKDGLAMGKTMDIGKDRRRHWAYNPCLCTACNDDK